MNPVYALGWLISRFVCFILCRVKVSGREFLPRTGGFIVACNHISYYDPPLVGSCVNRPMNYLAKKELFKNSIISKILQWCHALPVRRGTIDRSALDACRTALQSGQGLILFPEGTRSKTPELLPPKPGIGMIAVGAQVPIIPAYVQGSNRLSECITFRSRLRISFGEPITAEWIGQFAPEKDSYLAVVQEVMSRIRLLREQAG